MDSKHPRPVIAPFHAAHVQTWANSSNGKMRTRHRNSLQYQISVSATFEYRSLGVMAGLVPAIHAERLHSTLQASIKRRRVGGRDKPGHDDVGFAELSSMGRAHRVLL
jgi:hypothetical protein